MNKLAFALIRNRHGQLQAVPETARLRGMPGAASPTPSALPARLRTALKPLATALSAGLLALGAHSALAGTYVVTSNNDSGAGTLREAIDNANADDGSTIAFIAPTDLDLLSGLPTFTATTTLGVGAAVSISGGSLDLGSSSLTTTGAGSLSIGNGTAGNNGADNSNGHGGHGTSGGNASSGVSGTGFSLTNGITLSGGSGGSGGNGGTASVWGLGGRGGAGGAGGTGVSGTGFVLSNGGSLSGGAGGNGGNSGTGYSGGYTGGAGGSGGAGVSGTGFTLTNSGSVTGGSGGNGGNGSSASSSSGKYIGGNGGAGGAGGAGVTGSNFILNNTGTITGGTGGSGGAGGTNLYNPGSPGASGVGAAGVVSTGSSTITNAGTISGGLDGSGTIRANAVSLSGGANELIIHDGAVFIGNVVSTSGNTNGGDTLTLGGSTDGSFALSNIGSGAQFQGFANYSKAGDSTWTLTGTTTEVTNWTIKQGTLSIASDAALGAASSVLTLNGGTLLSTSSFTNAHAIALGSSGGTLSSDAATSTFSGVISGSGNLTVSGSAATVFTAANTYTGTTTIASGSSLQIGNGGTTGRLGTGAVTNNGSLSFNRSDNQTVANQISGSGSLTISGSGATILTADNSYTGTTTIASGSSLQVGDGGTSGSLGSGAVINGGDLLFYRSDNHTVANQISGLGAVVLSSGTTVFTADNSYQGGTHIQSGSTLQIGDGGTTGSLGTGNVSNSGSLVFNRSNAYTVANQISGNGNLTVAAGTLTLTAANLYTGATTVDSGAALKLTDGASLASTTVTVSNGATFNAQNSSVAGNLTNSGSVAVAAGKTLAVGGNFSSTGNLTLEVASMSSYAQIDVTGSASLSGTLHIDAASAVGLTSGSLASVIHADAGINPGSFTSVTDNSLLFDFAATYGANDVGLTISATSTPPSNNSSTVLGSAQAFDNRAGYGAARVLDQLFTASPTSELALLFVPLTNQQEVSNALSQALPLLTGGNTAASRNTLDSINRQVQIRMDEMRGQASGDAVLGDKHFWVKPFGTWTDQDSRQGVSGYDAETYGLALGVDGELNGALRLGLAFAYAKTDIDAKGGASQRADIDLYQLSAYGSYSLSEATALDFHAGIGRNRNEGRRHIAFASSVAKADFDSDTAYVGIGIGHRFDLGAKTHFTPSIRADYSWIRDESYTEKGAGALNLDVDSRSSEALVIGLDGKLVHQFNAQSSLLANLGVGYDTLNERSSVTAAFAGAPGAAFRTEGLKQEPWLVRGGIGAVFKTAGGLEITGRYDAEYREDFLSQTASVKLDWAF